MVLQLGAPTSAYEDYAWKWFGVVEGRALELSVRKPSDKSPLLLRKRDHLRVDLLTHLGSCNCCETGTSRAEVSGCRASAVIALSKHLVVSVATCADVGVR